MKRHVIPLKKCEGCGGRGWVGGVFYQLSCADCNAGGWVHAVTGQSLGLGSLVEQLNRMLNQAHQRINAMSRSQLAIGEAEQYQQNNRRGAGGSNYTGD